VLLPQIAFTLLLTTVCTFAASAQSLVGKWVREQDYMSTPTVLILSADGKYEISSGTESVQGTYSVTEKSFSITDTWGAEKDTKRGSGKYTLALDGDSLRFNTVSDKAQQRCFVLSASNWKKM
jgi:hypothetical protein